LVVRFVVFLGAAKSNADAGGGLAATHAHLTPIRDVGQTVPTNFC